MKVGLNTITNYEKRSLKLGDEIDIPLNVAQRWINKGIAHPVKEEVGPVEKVVIPVIKPVVKVTTPVVKIDDGLIVSPKVQNKLVETVVKTDEIKLSRQHEILPKITEKNINKPKISNPKKYNK